MKIAIQHTRLIKYLALSLLLILMGAEINAQTVPLVNVKGGATVYFGQNAPVIINGSVNNEQYALVTLNGQMKIYGSWNNNGLQTALDGSLVEFIGPEEADIKGSGNTQFFKILVNKETKEVRLTLATVLSNTPDGFVELAKGLFEVKCGVPYTNTFLGQGADGYAHIPVDAQFWLNDNKVIVKPAQYDILLKGVLKVLHGNFNAGKMLLYANDNDKVAELDINEGTLNVARGVRSLGDNVDNKLNYSQSGGKLNLHNNEAQYVGEPVAGGNYAFFMKNPNSKFNVTGGEININSEFGTPDLQTTRFDVATANPEVTGGIFRVINPTAADQGQFIAYINTTAPVGDFEIDFAGNNKSVIVESDLEVINGVRVKTNDNHTLIPYRVISLHRDLVVESNQLTPIKSNDENSAIQFKGEVLQNIRTTADELNLQYVRIAKNGSNVQYAGGLKKLNIENELRLHGQVAILDISDNTLEMPVTAKVTAGPEGTLTHPRDFSLNKYIKTAVAEANLTGGGKMSRVFKDATPLANNMDITYPIGNETAYAPAMIRINAGVTPTLGKIDVKTIPFKHKGLIRNDVVLERYWNVNSNVNFSGNNDDIGEVRFYYNQLEATTNESRYIIARYAPAWDDPAGSWAVEPGAKLNEVDYVDNAILSWGLPSSGFSGDWTAGEETAFFSIYYSRADGNYSDKNTWSHVGFGGPVANSAPKSKSNIVYIQGNTVTLDKNAEVNLLEVRKEGDGRTAGQLRLNGEFTITGEQFKLEEGASLYINSVDGIYEIPEQLGHIRTTRRILSPDASYVYEGGNNQVTGSGLPAQVKNLTISKTATSEVKLSRNTFITNKLHIENGIFNVDSKVIDGATAGRTLTMNGGEFLLRNSFPLNYAAPTFTKGTITFFIDKSIEIPSDDHKTPVAQYHNLKIKTLDMDSFNGEIKFANKGIIKIGKNFDLTQFQTKASNNVSNVFISNGSTVEFNGTEGEQLIPIYFNSQSIATGYALCAITYSKVVLSGNGKKKLYNFDADQLLSFTNGFTVDTLVFNAGSELRTDGNSIVLGKLWKDNGGTYIADNQQSYVHQGQTIKFGNKVIIFKAKSSPIDEAIIDIADANNYIIQDVEFAKNTKLLSDVRFGDMLIRHKLIATGNQNIKVYGNWVHDSSNNALRPEFIPANSIVEFTRLGDATTPNNIIINTYEKDTVISNLTKKYQFGEEAFNNLKINNPNNVFVKIRYAQNQDHPIYIGGLHVKGVLTLNEGNVALRKTIKNTDVVPSANVDVPIQYVKVDNPIARVSGYVDGSLLAKIPVGATSYKYEVGITEDGINKYSPVTFNTEGDATENAEGYLLAKVEKSTARFMNAGKTNFDIPNSGLKFDKLYKNVFYIEKPMYISKFELGNRTYNAELTINNSSLAAESNPAVFSFSSRKMIQNTGYENKWIKPFSYDNMVEPIVGARTASTITLSKLKHLGAFLLSHADIKRFYSRVANGNWEDPNSWSHDYYNGAPATSYPGDANNRVCEAYIGHEHKITLNNNLTINKEVGEGANAGVYLDSTAGGGKLYIRGNNFIDGTSRFRMLAYSWLKLEAGDGITLVGNGPIRTAERQFNFEDHNKSSFEYGKPDYFDYVSSGVGIPSVIKSLKVVGLLKMDKAITVTDSVYIDAFKQINLESQQLNPKTFTILGNLRLGRDAWFNIPEEDGQLIFAGDSLKQYVTLDETGIQSLHEFKVPTLVIDKNRDSSQVIFRRGVLNESITTGFSNRVQIEKELRFTANNKASIQLENYYTGPGQIQYGAGEWYMDITQGASVKRYATNGSFVDGELRMYVSDAELQNTQGVIFHVGSNYGYRPFNLSMNRVTPGILGVHQIHGYHPKQSELEPNSGSSSTDLNYPRSLMIKNYWRVLKDVSSSFQYTASNTNKMWFAANYLLPFDIPDFAGEFCFEFVMHNGNEQNGWRRVKPNHRTYNFGGPGVLCSGRIPDSESSGFNYNIGSAPSHIQVNNVNMNFANYNLGGGRRLLADYVVGEKGQSPRMFYSKNNGNWTDPNTWVSRSYDYDVNEYNAYPDERFDMVYIGNGVTVNLDGDIGTGWTGYVESPRLAKIQRLGGLVIEKNNGKPGRLNARCFRIRAAKVSLKDGGIIETGYLGGLPIKGNRGNFINQNTHNGINVSIAKEFNYDNHNNANIIFKPYGRIPEDNGDNLYLSLRNFYQPRNSSVHPVINSIRVYQNGQLVKAVSGLTRIDYGYSKETTANNFDLEINNPNSPNNETTTFNVELDISGLISSQTYYVKIHADENFDMEWDEVSTQVRIANPSQASRTVTIPVKLKNGFEHGTTTMRVYCMTRDIPLNVEAQYPSLTGKLRQSRYENGIRSDIKDFLISINRSPLDNRELVAYAMPGVPEKVSSIVVDSWEDKYLDTSIVNKRAPIVQLDYKIQINDSLVAKHGYLHFRELDMVGNVINRFHKNSFINYTLAPVDREGVINIIKEGTVKFIGEPYSRPDNKENFTSFDINKIKIKSPGNDVLFTGKSTRIVDNINFGADRCAYVDNTTLIIGKDATITSTNGNFSDKRMVKTYHDTEDRFGTLRKEVTQKINGNEVGNFDFTYPIGAREHYNPTRAKGSLIVNDEVPNKEWAYLEYTAWPKVPLEWFLHARTLDRMWKIGMKGQLYDNAVLELDMTYNDNEVRGDIDKYLPGKYIGDETNVDWSIDLGVNPTAKPSPIKLRLNNVGAYIVNGASINGFYTAGELTSMKERLVFYNRNSGDKNPSNVYNWFVPEVWSIDPVLKHKGGPASYYPGQLTEKDEVYIDNGKITFGKYGEEPEGLPRVTIDLLNLGKTDIQTPGVDYNAQLIYPKRRNVDNELKTLNVLNFEAKDAKSVVIMGDRKDQLTIAKDLTNTSKTPVFARHQNAGSKRYENGSIIFVKAGDSQILGEGLWNINQTSIILNKEGGLDDKLLIKSESYARTSMEPTTLTFNGGDIPNNQQNNYSYPTSSMKILSGVLRNDTREDMRVNGNLFIGEGGGLILNTKNKFKVDLRLILGPDPALRVTDQKQLLTIENEAELHVGFGSENVNLNKRELFIHENSELLLKKGSIKSFSSIKIKEKGKFVIENDNMNRVLVGFEKPSQINDIIPTKFLAAEDSEFSMYGGRLILTKNNTVYNNNDADPFAVFQSRHGEGFVGNNGQGASVSFGSRINEGAISAEPINYSIKSTIPFYHLSFDSPVSINNGNVVYQEFDKVIGQSKLLDDQVVIKGDLFVSRNAKFNTGISDIKLAGNLNVSGHFDAISGAQNNATKVFEFNGAEDQTIYHIEFLKGLEFYNVKINNTSNNVFLSKMELGTTNITVRNSLEFAETNTAVINTQIDNVADFYKRAVHFAPIGNVPVEQYIIRNGKGHIYGTQNNYLRAESFNTFYHLGGPTADEYYPMTVRIDADQLNKEGYLAGTFTKGTHPKINENVLIKQGTYPQFYWTLKPLNTLDPNNDKRFNLLGDNNMEITLHYPENTLIPEFKTEIGRHFMYSKSIHTPQDPSEAPGYTGGTWDMFNTNPFTRTTSTSLEVDKFGDIVLGELFGEKFYSIKNGNWNDRTTWSNQGHDRNNPIAERIPNRESDIVYISQNDHVTVNENEQFKVGEVYVNTEPKINTPGTNSYGKLEVKGRYNRLITRKFELDDASYLVMENAFGVCEPKVNKGVIYASHEANYGKSHYEYNSNEGPQITGVGLPNKVLSITQNNSTPEETSRLLTLFNEDNRPMQQVVGFLNIKQGKFYTNNRNLELNTGLKISKDQYDGMFDGSGADVVLRSLNQAGETISQNGANHDAVKLFINNDSGLRFYNTRLVGNAMVHKTVRNNETTQQFYIANELTRLIPGGDFYLNQQPANYKEKRVMPIMVMADRINIVVENDDPDAIRNVKNNGTGQYYNATDDDAERAIFYIQNWNTGPQYYSVMYEGNKGYVLRNIKPNTTYNYFITSSINETDGKYDNNPTSLFNTAKVITGNGTASGYLGMTTRLASKINDNFPTHFKIGKRNRAVYSRRYWTIDSVSYEGDVQLEFKNQTFDVADFTISDVFDRLSRYSNPQEAPNGKITSFKIEDVAMQYAGYWQGTDVNIGESFNKDNIVGDWFLTNRYALKRIFYSRQNGMWNDNNSWTYDESHIGDAVDLGEFPNDESDSVVIANQNEIILNVDHPFRGKTEGTGVQVGYPNDDLENFIWDNVENLDDAHKKGLGTLLIGDNKLLADFVTVYPGATIGTTAPNGFSMNNIRSLTDFNGKPNLSTATIYKYYGSEKQKLGSFVRNNVGRIDVETTGDGYLEIDRDITTGWGWSVLSGKMEMGKYKFIDNPSPDNLQIHKMNANAWITIGERGKDGPSYQEVFGAPKVSKKIDVNSTVEFIGKNHNLSTYVEGIEGVSTHVFDNNMLVTGAGNTEAENTPSYFNNKITILGNLEIKPFDNNAVKPMVIVRDLIEVSVKKSVSNDGVLENNGVIEVGECEP